MLSIVTFIIKSAYVTIRPKVAHNAPSRLCPWYGHHHPQPPLARGRPSFAHDLLQRVFRFSLVHCITLNLQPGRAIPKNYQLVPVLMALETIRVRRLIPDDQ